LSWDETWLRMKRTIEAAGAQRPPRRGPRPQRRPTEPQAHAVSEVAARV